MALITCSECGREISDKANACIHCGNPIEVEKLIDDSYMTIGNQKLEVMEVKAILDVAKTEKVEAIKMLNKLTSFGLMGSKIIIEMLLRNQNAVKPGSKIGMDGKSSNISKATCPNCGSDNIQIVTKKFSLLTGFMTNKTERVCVNCNTKL